MESTVSLPVFREGTPLYEQLYRHLVEEIRRGRPAPGEKLPSKRRLCALLGVSMSTVETAYSLLTAESYVISRPRSGYTVADLLPLMPCRQLFATPAFLSRQNPRDWRGVEEVVEATDADIERLSSLRAPREVVAVFRQPLPETDDLAALAALPGAELCLALDSVQDPGNLGTIVRVADWFGITHIFASPDTADAFAPKVVQATMGAIGRVTLHYCPLPELLCLVAPDVPRYGTFLDGRNLYGERLENRGVVGMGNEGRGISAEVARSVSHRLLIPNYPPGRPTSESLNVAVATAIVCAAFRSRA